MTLSQGNQDHHFLGSSEAERHEDIELLLKLDNNEEVGEIKTYNQVLDYIQQDDTQGLDDAELFLFRGITVHQGPLTKEDPQYKGSSYNVMVEWETGETSCEPLSLIAKDDSITCAVYAKKNGLLDTTGWKFVK